MRTLRDDGFLTDEDFSHFVAQTLECFAELIGALSWSSLMDSLASFPRQCFEAYSFGLMLSKYLANEQLGAGWNLLSDDRLERGGGCAVVG